MGLAEHLDERAALMQPLDDVDTVVLACGSVSNDTLYHELRPRHPAVHVLGDAYAPRRLSFATRQARELVRAVLT